MMNSNYNREDFSNTYAPKGKRKDEHGRIYVPEIVSDCWDLEGAVNESIKLLNYLGAEYGYLNIFMWGGDIKVTINSTYNSLKDKYVLNK